MHPVTTQSHPGRYMRRGRRSSGSQVKGWVLLLCGLLAASPAWSIVIPLTGGGQKGAYHRQIEKLEQQWHTALLSGDNAAMAAMLADSYVGIGPAGAIESKSEEVQSRASGQERVQKLDVEDRKIRIYGTTAVVTSKVRVEGVYSGEVLLGEYRYTRVWSMTRGQWRVVSFEANRVHDSTARRQ